MHFHGDFTVWSIGVAMIEEGYEQFCKRGPCFCAKCEGFIKYNMMRIINEQQEHLGCPKLSDLGPFVLLVLLKSHPSFALPRLHAKQEELRKSIEKQLDASFGGCGGRRRRNVATCLGG